MANSASLQPRLVVANAAQAIDYYKRAFGAEEVERHADPSGRIVNAALAIGDSRITLKDEDATDRAPSTAGSPPILLMLYVDDVDNVGDRMVAGGGTVVFPIDDFEYGRVGRIRDPYGHVWMIFQRTD